jgi:hypothetical protein
MPVVAKDSAAGDQRAAPAGHEMRWRPQARWIETETN